MAEPHYNRLPGLALKGSDDSEEQGSRDLVFDDQEVIFASLSDSMNYSPRKFTIAECISRELLGWTSFGKSKVMPTVASTFFQFGQYAKTAIFGSAEKTSDNSDNTYSNIAIRGIEFGLTNVALPVMALLADVQVIGATVVTSTLATCAVNVAGLGVKSVATGIASEKAKGFYKSVDSGLNCLNAN